MGRKLASHAVLEFSPKKARATRKHQLIEDSVIVPIQPQIKKTFHLKDLKKISPLTDNQDAVFTEWENGQNVVMDGVPGCGKTFLAMFLALQAVLDPDTEQNKIVILRAATVTGQTLGLLPGTLEEKMLPFETPYRECCDELFPWKNSYDNLKELGKIEFESLEHCRGVSINNAVIIMDEAQNFNEETSILAYTRVGKNSRVITTQNLLQNDIGNKSSYPETTKALKKMKQISFIEFGIDDIVRSGFVKSFIIARYGK